MKPVRWLVLTGALIAAGAAAQELGSGVERRPCVAPGSPYGCDSTLRGAPEPMTSFPQGAPSPEQRPGRSVMRVPLSPTPEAAPPPAPPPGTVTVKPAPPEGLDASGAPGEGVGPPVPKK